MWGCGAKASTERRGDKSADRSVSENENYDDLAVDCKAFGNGTLENRRQRRAQGNCERKELESQRDSITQPGVARNELRRVLPSSSFLHAVVTESPPPGSAGILAGANLFHIAQRKDANAPADRKSVV